MRHLISAGAAALLLAAVAPPSLAAMPKGCAFTARCPVAGPECRDVRPPLAALAGGGLAACHRLPEAAAFFNLREAAQ